jgi:hypothetical protein
MDLKLLPKVTLRPLLPMDHSPPPLALELELHPMEVAGMLRKEIPMATMAMGAPAKCPQTHRSLELVTCSLRLIP